MIRFFLLKFATKFISSIQYSVGLSHITIMRKNYKKIRNINDLEYKVFSQNGENGIIDYLLHSLKLANQNLLKERSYIQSRKYSWDKCTSETISIYKKFL